MTIPIALLMGVYLRRLRPGKVLESSAAWLCSGDAGHLGRTVGFAKPFTGAAVFTLIRNRSGGHHHHLRIRCFGHCRCGFCLRLATT